jgi:hypothetical protein
MPKNQYHRAASMSDVLTGNGKVSINFTVCSHIKKRCRIAAAPFSFGGDVPLEVDGSFNAYRARRIEVRIIAQDRAIGV